MWVKSAMQARCEERDVKVCLTMSNIVICMQTASKGFHFCAMHVIKLVAQ